MKLILWGLGLLLGVAFALPLLPASAQPVSKPVGDAWWVKPTCTAFANKPTSNNGMVNLTGGASCTPGGSSMLVQLKLEVTKQGEMTDGATAPAVCIAPGGTTTQTVALPDGTQNMRTTVDISLYGRDDCTGDILATDEAVS